MADEGEKSLDKVVDTNRGERLALRTCVPILRIRERCEDFFCFFTIVVGCFFTMELIRRNGRLQPQINSTNQGSYPRFWSEPAARSLFRACLFWQRTTALVHE